MGSNEPLYAAKLAQIATSPNVTLLAAAQSIVELRQLAVSAVFQLEALKEEVHRLAGDKTNDVRTVNLLRHTSQLINKMRFGE
jgi:hypothetical protein